MLPIYLLHFLNAAKQNIFSLKNIKGTINISKINVSLSETGEFAQEANSASSATIFNNHHITITQDPYPPLNNSPNLFDQLNSYLLANNESDDNNAMITTTSTKLVDNEPIGATSDYLLNQFIFEPDKLVYNGENLKKEYFSFDDLQHTQNGLI
jgi:hypothetical protein